MSAFTDHLAEGLHTGSAGRWLSPLPQSPVTGPGAVRPGLAGQHRRELWLPCRPGPPLCSAALVLHQAAFPPPLYMWLPPAPSDLRVKSICQKAFPEPWAGSVPCSVDSQVVGSFFHSTSLHIWLCLTCVSAVSDCLPPWAVNLTRRGRAALTHPFPSLHPWQPARRLACLAWWLDLPVGSSLLTSDVVHSKLWLVVGS